MKFQFAALVALLSVRSAQAFTARGPASHRFRTTSHQQRVRELVILQVVDDNEYEGFEEEDFVDDGLDGPPLDVRVSKFDSSPSGRLGEVEVIIEQPPSKTETVRDEPTTVTVANDDQEDPSKMRVKEIKAELDSWGVDYDDCFEKTDLVKRLVEARKNPGQQIGQQLKVEMMEEATTLSEQGQKEKAAMQSFGYVGLTEEEFFAMQAAKARESSDHQRGTVKQTPVNQAGTNNGAGGNSRKSVWLEETPEEPKKKKKTIKSRSGSSVWLEDTKPKTAPRQNKGNTINSRSGSSVWLDDTKPSGPPYTTHRKETMQLEDVPAPKKKKRQSTPRVVEPQPPKSVLEDMLGGGSGSNGANSPVSNGASRQPSILLEDIPSKEIPFGFSGRKKKNSRGPTILQENPNTIRREEPPPKPQQPTADGKGYVGMTEDEYFAQQAAWRSNGMQTAAPMPQKRGVPFGMTEEEFLTQQKAIGIVTETPSSNGSHGVQPPPVREVAQGQAIRGMSEKEFEYWNNRDTHNLGGGANFMGGMNPDQLL